MLLTHVHIENFKRFETLDIDLEPLDCFVGPNNSGKTTLLQALSLFDFCVHHCLSKKNGGYETKRRSIQPEMFYVLPVADPSEIWTDRKLVTNKKQNVISIRATFDRGRDVTATVKLDYNRFGIGIDTEDDSQEWLGRLAAYRIAYLPVFSVFLAQEERRTPAIIEDELSRGRVHGVIRNLLLDLKKQGRDGELIEVLKRSFPTLKEMRIDFDEVSDRYISVLYEEAGRAREFDIFSAGSGFQQFLYLFGFIGLRDPTMVLLDEPDVHLHGVLQKALLQELHRLVDGNKQVLLATHSRELITRVNPENIISLEQESPRRLAVEFEKYDTLDRLGSLDPTQLPVIQTYRRVLVLEDRADRELLSLFGAKCLGQAVWQEVERRLAVCYAKGNPCNQPVDRLRDQLQQMLSLRGRTLEAFVVADRDYYPDVAQLLGTLPTKHIRWHIWSRTEIENYLLCPDAILRLLRGATQDHRDLEEPLFRQEFDRLVEASRKPARARLANAFDAYRRLLDKKWDPGTIAGKAEEYLDERWETEKAALADAKDIVLPGIKRWLQEHGLRQFSNKSLADALLPDDLPEEVHALARSLAGFAGLKCP